MMAKLVFIDWQDDTGASVYQTEIGVQLSLGDLHSGSTFDAMIDLDYDDARLVRDAARLGYHPVMRVEPATRGGGQ
jgi:hypothetical protein